MNTIFIHDLRVETRIGVYDWERHLPQTLRLDLELGLPSDKAFRPANLADALDYAAVVARMQGVRRGPSAHAARALRRRRSPTSCCGEFGAPWVKVRVAKLAPLAGREGDRRRDRAAATRRLTRLCVVDAHPRGWCCACSAFSRSRATCV